MDGCQSLYLVHLIPSVNPTAPPNTCPYNGISLLHSRVFTVPKQNLAELRMEIDKFPHSFLLTSNGDARLVFRSYMLIGKEEKVIAVMASV